MPRKRASPTTRRNSGASKTSKMSINLRDETDVSRSPYFARPEREREGGRNSSGGCEAKVQSDPILCVSSTRSVSSLSSSVTSVSPVSLPLTSCTYSVPSLSPTSVPLASVSSSSSVTSSSPISLPLTSTTYSIPSLSPTSVPLASVSPNPPISLPSTSPSSPIPSMLISVTSSTSSPPKSSLHPSSSSSSSTSSTSVPPPVPSQPRKCSRRLPADFYDQECVSLAKALLGKVAVRVVGGRRVSARVVETESYLGGADQASHSYGGRRTPRNEPMYMKPGTAYVYSIYGMYYCFNVSSRGEGACVLVRAAEAVEGVEVMAQGRAARRGPTAPPLKPHQLCNGPSKLCQALALTKDSANKLDLAESDVFWMEEEEREKEGEEGVGGEERLVVSTRVGIDSYGPEWAKKPLRFYILGNKCVSVRDRVAEREMVR